MSDTNEAKQCLEQSLDFFSSDLFNDVQLAGIFADSKTFADAYPKFSWSEIFADYQKNQTCKGFDLSDFVQQHFVIPETILLSNDTDKGSVKSYIESLWPKLERQPDKLDLCSLLPLSHPYIVPGGRFREIYYWDSYFTALGLNESGRQDIIRSMILNFIDLQDTLGCIPNGNRSYYNSRSQPPVLGLMVEMYLQNIDTLQTKVRRQFLEHCVQGLDKEYQFWMHDKEQLVGTTKAIKRVVKMPNGVCLNRYWDDSVEPRPESYREDIEAAENIAAAKRPAFYRNIRAACESGWDFSSRWLANQDDLSTIQTTHIVPIDLNCLLYKLETLLSQFYTELLESELSSKFAAYAQIRKDAINQYLWDEQGGFYHDFDFIQGQKTTIQSLAACLPLFCQIASHQQAEHIADKLENSFLMEGGLVTTLNDTAQQWDAPNGWAPLQYFAVVGLMNYGFAPLSVTIMNRWMTTVEQQFITDNNMMEKYNVQHSQRVAQGGEYEVQHGFGWTNGVSLAFYQLLDADTYSN
ncbi:alpha,alpha-trehalase TreF [Paraglaciecola psychrophila]|uniref:Alpha,alpha-trehalase n=1 Tax=Paraglaciecola psychrophila 170 TaxID=1129794 RepID=K7AMP8_9ALTE|nr:alpha,alpha-trehalase TreF [Paraglaciecola psychrophila]AGH42769.1 alpha,alpha-trehalase [Paraglaciecola psychrophila 170]GAC36665.1 cytoplasmic trehalase [Paraglaciecola psychrophila 170]